MPESKLGTRTARERSVNALLLMDVLRLLFGLFRIVVLPFVLLEVLVGFERLIRLLFFFGRNQRRLFIEQLHEVALITIDSVRLLNRSRNGRQFHCLIARPDGNWTSL